jgi:hypothetical protein
VKCPLIVTIPAMLTLGATRKALVTWPADAGVFAPCAKAPLCISVFASLLSLVELERQPALIGVCPDGHFPRCLDTVETTVRVPAQAVDAGGTGI